MGAVSKDPVFMGLLLTPSLKRDSVMRVCFMFRVRSCGSCVTVCGVCPCISDIWACEKVLVVSGVSCVCVLFTVLRKYYAIIGKFCAYYTHTSRHKRKRHTHLKLADYHILLSINRHVSYAPLFPFCMRLEATALYSVHKACSRIICALCALLCMLCIVCSQSGVGY